MKYKTMVNVAKKDLIMREMEHIPEPLFNEILDFIHFLKTKARKEKLETAIASESSLQKDWLSEEEDKAWQDL
jgi:hypothetical protein